VPLISGRGGLSSGQKLQLIIAGLLAVGVAVGLLTVLYWRRTRPTSTTIGLEALTELEDTANADVPVVVAPVVVAPVVVAPVVVAPVPAPVVPTASGPVVVAPVEIEPAGLEIVTLEDLESQVSESSASDNDYGGHNG